MTYPYFHPDEEFQVWVLEDYAYAHPSSRYLIEFPDDEIYVGKFENAYDSENGGELDIEMDDPRYDEFHQVVFEVIEIVRDGKRHYKEFLSVDYRDFPSKVTDLDTGTVVYPAG